MTAFRLTVAVMALVLAGCAAGEYPALAPEDIDDDRDPYFLPPGFMGGLENRIHYAPPAIGHPAPD